MKLVKNFLHNYRFELFLLTVILILFGSLIFPEQLVNSYLFTFFFLLNIIASINLISKKNVRYVLIGLFIVSTFIFGSSLINIKNSDIDYVKFTLYFLFYVVTAYEIITQVWLAKKVNKNLIIGVISGYITLGFIGFFIFMTVEMSIPGSFGGELLTGNTLEQNSDSLLYFSYITLMTIGYGEIVPLTGIAQKATILLGLMGQFYLVIITAVVVGKFIGKSIKDKEGTTEVQ